MNVFSHLALPLFFDVEARFFLLFALAAASIAPCALRSATVILPQRPAAARCPSSFFCSAVRFLRLPAPPSRPNATAAGFFPLGIGKQYTTCTPLCTRGQSTRYAS